MMFIGYYIIEFILGIPEIFPTATPWQALGWITGIGMGVVAIIFSALISLVWQQAKNNGKQGAEILEKQDEIIKDINANYRNDIELRKDHNELKATVNSHEERISKLEKK